MKRLIVILIVIAILFHAKFSWALNSSELSRVASSPVHDPGVFLSDDTHYKLDWQLQHSSEVRISIWLVPSLGEQSVEDLASSLKAWNSNDQVMIIMAMEEHRSRIETSRQMESYLSNQTCFDILHTIVGYYMQNDDIEGALINAIIAINSAVALSHYQTNQLLMWQMVMPPATFSSLINWIP